MFTYKDKQYELKINLERQKYIEAAMNGKSLVAEWANSQGMFSILTCETVFKFCLKEVGANTFIDQNTAVMICDGLIETEGYPFVALMIYNCMESDMPFLFHTN